MFYPSCHHGDSLPPAVVVHGIDDALAAMAAGWPVCLLSAPGAAIYAGCLWWRALTDAARADHPATPCADLLDCGDAPGIAMAALRVGQRRLILDARTPALGAVRGAAAEIGAAILIERPPALDLGRRGADRHLLAWLTPTPLGG